MQQLSRGQRVRLDDLTSTRRLTVTVAVTVAGSEVDLACFGVDDAQKLADDRYFIFYNQVRSPEGAISLQGGAGTATFDLDLDPLPATVTRLVFTATIDGGGTMAQLSAGRWSLTAAGAELAGYDLSGADFAAEKAVILAELYRKDGVWRVGVVGQGFNGGLSALLAHFGGEEAGGAAPPAPAPPPAAQAAPGGAPAGVNLKKVELEKRMEREAPQLLSLAKKAQVSLEKRGLGDHRAKVALCLDISYSMKPLFDRGQVQQLAEKVLALGTRFDDDGEIDIFLFGKDAHDAGGMSLDNYRGLVDELVTRYPLELGTYYGRAMRLIRQHYFGSGEARSTPLRSEQPVYVMFITDGAPMDPDESTRQVVSSAYEPLFWQFMAIGASTRSASGSMGAGGPGSRINKVSTPSGGGEFAFLEGLDDLEGRYVDNADFFSVADPGEIPDEQLYELLMGEYPDWVRLLPGLGLS